MVDGLELFSCLIIFSDSKYEDKIKFIFDLFDLNDINILSKVDIEFMIHSILKSTFRLYGNYNEISFNDIKMFVNDSI